ncbi:DMT family transporter [Terrarubrum flagellatum]|uniref:DMT family transporter n=1 Tax=Terrirubrum flagellatum TaxID=2895980 RepID=UPI0031455A65
MSFLWVAATLIAAAGQTARNAMQSSLTAVIGTVGATQVRFLYGLPFALAFLLLTTLVSGESIPAMTGKGFAFTAFGALTQITATALMLATMRQKSFSVTTAYIKLEPVLVAVAGFIVLGDVLTPLKLLAIVIATAGVVTMSLKPGTGATLLTELRPALLGIVAGACFGLSAIGFRGGILELGSGSFYMRATTTLVWGLALQTAILLIYLLVFDRTALTKSLAVWRQSLFAGFLGAFASQFWFLGFSLTTAANVRTLALVEVLMAQAISRKVMAQEVAWREIAGMALIVLGVAVLLWAQR